MKKLHHRNLMAKYPTRMESKYHMKHKGMGCHINNLAVEN